MQRLIFFVETAAFVGMLAMTFPCHAQPVMPSSDISLPQDVAKTMKQLLALAQQEFDPPPGASQGGFYEGLPKAHRSFLTCSKSSINRSPRISPRESRNPQALALSATWSRWLGDYGHHPDRYTEFLEYYEHWARTRNPRPVVLEPRPLAPKHAVEKYRPTWELFLLAPGTRGSRFIRERCFEAITEIRNNASIPLLVYLYQRANAGVRSGYERDNALSEQVAVLVALNAYRNSIGLHAVLQCQSMSSQLRSSMTNLSGIGMKNRIIGMLTYTRSDLGKQWREVIERELSENKKLSDADRKFLEDVLKAPVKK